MTSGVRILLLTLIFFLPYSKAVIETCVVGALALWIASGVREMARISRLPAAARPFWRRFIPHTSIDRAVFFFLSACLCSVVLSVDPAKSLHGFITKTLEWFVVFYLMTGAFSQRRHIWGAVRVYVLTTLFTALDALAQFYWLGHDIFRNRVMVRDGATAAFSHPNSLAGYCVVAVPFFLSLCFLPLKKPRYRFALIFLWGLVSGVLVLTFSRSAWLAALLGMGVVLYHRNRKVLIGAVLAAVLLSWCFVKFSPLEVRKRTRTRPEIVQDDIQWRTHVWEASLSLVKERPLFGYGLNTYMDQIQRTPAGTDPIYAHNCFVQVLVETGLLGLAGFLWILTALSRAAFRSIRTVSSTPEARALAVIMLGAVSGLTAFVAHSFFDVHFYSLQLSVYFWLIAGILMSIIRVLHTESACGCGGHLRREENP